MYMNKWCLAEELYWDFRKADIDPNNVSSDILELLWTAYEIGYNEGLNDD